MADAGVMRIRVVADTTQAEREVERAGERIERLQKRVDASAKLIDSTVKASWTGIQAAGMASLAYKNRKRLGQFARTSARAQMVRNVIGAGGGAAGLGRAATLASNLHPFLKIGATLLTMTLLLKGGNKATAKNTESVGALTQQVRYMREASAVHSAAVSKATQASLASRESFEDFQARQATAADPYQRGLEFQRQRMQTMGTAITQYQSAVLTSLDESQRKLDEQRAARDRTVATLTAPFKEFGRDVNRFGVRIQTWVGQQATEPGGLGDAAVAGSMGFPGVAPLAAGYLGMKYYYGARSAADLAIAQGQAKTAQATADELMRLQMRGPAATTAGIPTIRPGTAAGHTFRVRQEREELQREATRVWQDRILALMEALVEASQMDPEAVARTRIQFGREPGDTVVGVE